MTSRPLTGRDYLEQLRARRLAARAAEDPQSPVVPLATPADPINEMLPEAQLEQPVPSQAVTQPEPGPTAMPPVPPAAPAAQTPATQPSDVPGPTTPQATPAAQFDDPYGESALFPGQYKPLPEQDVLVWTAPNRAFKPRSRQYYSTIAIIVFLISLILFFAGQMLPIAVVISVAFLAYVLASVPPQPVEIKFTTFGIRFEDKLYYWEQLGRFWFETKFDQPLVHVEYSQFPYRLTFLVGDQTVENLRSVLQEVLLEQKPDPTALDKAADWLQKRVPLEIDS